MAKNEYKEDRNREEKNVSNPLEGQKKKKKKKYSSSEDSSEGGYYEAPKSKPVAIDEPSREDPLVKKIETKKPVVPLKPEPKRVFVDDEDSDDGIGRWNS